MEGNTHGCLGSVLYNMGKFKQARRHHKLHLEIARERGDKTGEENAYCNLGNAYRSLGDFKKAIEYHKQYLSIAKELGDNAGEGAAYCNLESDHHSLGDLKRAWSTTNNISALLEKRGTSWRKELPVAIWAVLLMVSVTLREPLSITKKDLT